MIRIENIDKIVLKLKNEFSFGKKDGDFGSKKISYKILEKLVFGNIIIGGKEVRLLGESGDDFLKNYIWIYKSEANEIVSLKNRFLEEILKEIKFCPFCGKVPLVKFEKGRIFDLDHFFPKSRDERLKKTIKVYPHLAINLYNLIPCCKGCNFIKSNRNFFDEEKEIFHPYFGFIDKNGNIFDDKEQTLDKKYSFTLLDKKKEIIFGSGHSDFFKLSEIYLNSHDTFNIFNFIQDKRTKIKDEQMRFKKSSKTLEQLKDYFFKNYYPIKEQDILKYSNGKLKKDLIENLKIIDQKN